MDGRSSPEADAGRPAEPIARILATAAALIAFVTLLLTLRILYICYSPVPWGDMWDFWNWTSTYGAKVFLHLASQHNEHRIAVARLFFLLDQYCFYGTEKSLAVFIPLIQLAHALALWKLSTHVPGISRTLVIFISSVSLTVMFSLQQFANFTWYFQIQFVAVYLGATLSCICLLRVSTELDTDRGPGGRHHLRLWLTLTVLSAIATTYCMANGLLIWLALLSLSVQFGLPRRVHGLLLAAGAISWTAYFVGYIRPADHPSPLQAVLHLELFLRFLLTVVGSPFADFVDGITGGGAGTIQLITATIGTVGIIAFGTLAAVTFFDGKANRNRASRLVKQVYIHLMLFDLASMALIASGRFTFPIAEALTSRYTTPALIFWLLLVTYTVVRLAQALPKWRIPELTLETVVLAVLLSFLFFNKPAHAAYAKGYRQYLREAEVAISNDVFDQPIWMRVNHNLDAVKSLSDYMRTANLSLFHKQWSHWLGTRLAQHYRITPPADCRGFVDQVKTISADRPGYRIEGWTWNLATNSASTEVLLTDGEERLIGWGLSGYPRPDVAASLHNSRAGESGWIGYVPGKNRGKILAFAILAPSRRVCPIGSAEPRR